MPEAIETERVPEFDLLTEECLTFAQAARWLPSFRGPGKNSPNTIARWCQEGLLSDSRKHRYYLQKVRIGGTNFTSKEALRRFFAKLDDGPSAARPRKRKSSEKRTENAKDILRRRGLLK